jgi:hypothetical protein
MAIFFCILENFTYWHGCIVEIGLYVHPVLSCTQALIYVVVTSSKAV